MIRKRQSRLSKPRIPEEPTEIPNQLGTESSLGKPQVYSVSGLTKDLRAILEAAFDSVWVEGEISNFRTVASGHSYFVLKDDKAQIRCVLFKGYRAGIKFQPADGDQVLLFGRISVYDARGEYQVIVESIEPRGLGALQKAYEQLKKPELALESYRKLVNELPYAQCWDPGGWFWKPAKAAQKRITALENK